MPRLQGVIDRESPLGRPDDLREVEPAGEATGRGAFLVVRAAKA